MLNSKEIGYLWAISLFVASVVVILWEWLRGKLWGWRFRRRLKQKGPNSEDSSKLIPESLYIVQISDTDVSCASPNGRIEKVDWDDLQSVEISTTDEGPFLPDVFWLLSGSNTSCVIPGAATGEMELLHRLQKLPGFRNNAGINAMASVKNARFLCWQRDNHSSS
jgi:hypothetical protein